MSARAFLQSLHRAYYTGELLTHLKLHKALTEDAFQSPFKQADKVSEVAHTSWLGLRFTRKNSVLNRLLELIKQFDSLPTCSHDLIRGRKLVQQSSHSGPQRTQALKGKYKSNKAPWWFSVDRNTSLSCFHCRVILRQLTSVNLNYFTCVKQNKANVWADCVCETSLTTLTFFRKRKPSRHLIYSILYALKALKNKNCCDCIGMGLKCIHTSTQVITSSPFSRSQSVNTLMAGSSFWPAMAFSKLDSTQSRRISVLEAMDDSTM